MTGEDRYTPMLLRLVVFQYNLVLVIPKIQLFTFVNPHALQASQAGSVQISLSSFVKYKIVEQNVWYTIKSLITKCVLLRIHFKNVDTDLFRNKHTP